MEMAKSLPIKYLAQFLFRSLCLTFGVQPNTLHLYNGPTFRSANLKHHFSVFGSISAFLLQIISNFSPSFS